MSDPDRDTLARLTAELEKLNQHRFIRLHDRPLRLLAFQFARGLAFGLGSVIGATLLVSVLVWWLSQFEFLPIIGDWASQLINQIDRSNIE